MGEAERPILQELLDRQAEPRPVAHTPGDLLPIVRAHNEEDLPHTGLHDLRQDLAQDRPVRKGHEVFRYRERSRRRRVT
jgi:hypothetical protein